MSNKRKWWAIQWIANQQMENKWVRGYAIWEEKDIVCLSSNFDHSQLFISHKGRAFPLTSSKWQRGKKEEYEAQKQCNWGCTVTPACTAVKHNTNTSLFPQQGQPQDTVQQWAHSQRTALLGLTGHVQRANSPYPKERTQTFVTMLQRVIKDNSLLEFSTLSSFSPSQAHGLC